MKHLLILVATATLLTACELAESDPTSFEPLPGGCPDSEVEDYAYHATLDTRAKLEDSYRGHANEANPPAAYQVMREVLGGPRANVSDERKRIILTCLQEAGWPPLQ